jgi:hypothetical protein
MRTLRHVYEHRDEAAQRGRAAAKQVREDFSWSRITQIYAERIGKLHGMGSLQTSTLT